MDGSRINHNVAIKSAITLYRNVNMVILLPTVFVFGHLFSNLTQTLKYLSYHLIIKKSAKRTKYLFVGCINSIAQDCLQ